MIERLDLAHVDGVARLHIASVPGRLSEFGHLATRAYYVGVVASRSGVGMVEVNGHTVCGFVFGSTTPSRVQRAVFSARPLSVALGLGVGVLRRPVCLRWLVQSLRGPDEGLYDNQVPELTYLAVAPEGRGRGVGRRLVESFTDAMRVASVPAYELSVDEENRAAIGFYEKLGFRQVGRYREFGLWLRRYRRDIAH